MCDTKVCRVCKEEKPKTKEYFYARDSWADGFDITCKPCRNKHLAQNNRDRRAKEPGRVKALYYSYRMVDKSKGLHNDLDYQYLLGITGTECTYCGVTEGLGADRIDNSLGHTNENVVPCCGACNILRGDRYTMEEMYLIGAALRPAIKQIKELRTKTTR